jgi:aldehyde oxidoreductase
LYVQTPRPATAFGQAGVGEGPLTSPQVSVLNAIHDACGVRIRSIPAYLAKVLKALTSEKKAYDVSDAMADGYVFTGGIGTLK